MQILRMFSGLTGWICALLLPSGIVAADDESLSSASPPWHISNEQPVDSLYIPRDIQKAYDKGTRSTDGKPGPNYWQNHSSHNMRITVSPPDRRVQGEQEIIYTNNSPDALDHLLFRMYMNSHQPEAMRDKPYPSEFLSKGITVEEFSVDGKVMDWAKNGGNFADFNIPEAQFIASNSTSPCLQRAASASRCAGIMN